MPDYYQYLSWIKSGQLGQLLLSSRYSAIALPKALVHPLFSVTGIATGFFDLSTPTAYLILRIVATFIFFFTFYRFMCTLFPSVKHRIVGLLFLLTGTGFYYIAPPGSLVPLVEAIPWSGHFNIISKYSLPPHHLLALAAWMGILLSLKRHFLFWLTIFLSWVLALLNPSIFLFSLIFLISGMVLHFLFSPKLETRNLKLDVRFLLLFLLSVSPIIVYNLITLRSIPPWSIMYARMLHFNPPTTLLTYLLSLGPLLPVSLIGVWTLRKKLTFMHAILLSWAYLPIALFPFVGSVLPINYSRLLQTYQYIPITLLAVMAISAFTRPGLVKQGPALNTLTLRKLDLRKLIGMFLIFLISLYGAIAYIATIQPQLEPHNLSYYNVFIPKPLLAAFRFLDAIPKEQVIVSGEYVSEMIPALTKHRSAIGRDDVIADYYPLQNRTFAFLDGRMTEEDALKFVREQKVNYVLFGVDTKPFLELPTKNYRFLVPKFTVGNITIAAID